MKIRKRIIVLMLMLIPIFVGCTPEEESVLGTMEILVFGIGRADSILITTETHTVMIDTGERQHGSHIVSYLLCQNIDTIDYLIITHFDRDHVGGAYVILNEIDVRNVIVPNYSRASNHVNRFDAAMEEAQLEPLVLTETIRFILDGAAFTVNPSQLGYIHVSSRYEDDAVDQTIPPSTGDDYSLVVSITHGGNSFLFTGDAVAGRLQELLENDEIMNTNYDFLKVPRHGRHNRRSIEFIQAISPRYAVITGFHPDLLLHYYPERPSDERVIAALERVGAEIFFTMSTGVRVRSDGTNLTLQYENFLLQCN